VRRGQFSNCVRYLRVALRLWVPWLLWYAQHNWVASLHWLFLFRALAHRIGHEDRCDDVNQFKQRVFPGSGAVDVSQVGMSAW
jgi:hypothetical protein